MKNKRLLSLGLTIVLTASVCGCRESTETMNEAEEDTEAAEAEETAEAAEIMERAAGRSAGGSVEKEETVYVNADAGGTVKSITVSSWLKNGDGAEELTDVTRLTDVVNVKGDETFTQDGDTYVWAADGRDIYYQGETAEALPVDVKVTYYLDEKETAPEELAGKSGKVKIRFDYENHSTQKTEIGGKETELYVPFVAASTLILDSDRFVNVEVENGRILSDGKNTVVAGVAMPGLYDSLDLLNLEGFEDVDIPEYVEVTADVTDFELAMTATILMPDVLSRLDTDDMDGFDDLKEDMEELNDATYELIDGCVELDDGVQELKDNMPDLWDGAVELDDGAVELNDGAWELDDGAQDLMDGADKLNDGAKDIREGAKELDQGVGTLQAGAGLLNENMPKLTGGVNSLAAGLQSLQNPMMLGPDGKSGDAEHPYIKASAGLLRNGVDTLVAGVLGMGNTLEQKIAENQIEMQEAQNQVVLLTGNLKKAAGEAEALQEQLTELAKQMGMLPSAGSTEPKTVKEETPASEEPDSAQTDETAASEREENQEEPDGEPDALEKSSADTEDERKSSEASEGEKESSEASEGEKKSSEESEGEEKSSEAPEGENKSPVAQENGKEPSAASENPEEETDSVPKETAEEEPISASEQETEEEPAASSEAAEEDETEKLEDAGEAEEQSEFAETYLESLSESDGMTSMRMVQMADAGQGAGSAAVSDPAAVIEGYQKVVKLQTDLIVKLNEITQLQNQLREAAANYAGLVGADTALQQVAGQLGAGADAEQLAQLTEGMAALETSIGQIYDGVALINSQMGTLTAGAAELQQGIGSLSTGTDALKAGTEKLYQGGIDLREGSKELYDGTQELKDGTEELKDGTQELKDGTQELKDGVVDLVDGADELKNGTEELLDGVHEYNDDGIQKLYDTVNVDLQNLLDRVDAIADLSGAYQSFSGKSDAIEGSVKFIIETEAIELDED
ncbi:MAG: hypothetical protein HFI17_07530 [Lachnospiraceae bacterium]|jgi:putative membrane protein|nr:hypothetical protein [Lachnospiraceae bacterium]